MIDFEDLNPYNGTQSPFPVCNEIISVWRKALEGISVESAAGICSGGEVSFFAILPTVKKKLTLIDHSYTSMYFALGKYHLIEKLGAIEAYKLLSETGKNEVLKAIFEEANNNLPTKSPKDSERTNDFYGYSPLHTRHWFSYWYGGKSIYEDITEEGVKQFRDNKDKVSFLHGDLNDLVERGPFDLVYLSNALEYQGRNGGKFDIDKMVKPGGYVAHCYARGGIPRIQYETIFEERNAPRQGYGLSWTYKLCKVPE